MTCWPSGRPYRHSNNQPTQSPNYAIKAWGWPKIFENYHWSTGNIATSTVPKYSMDWRTVLKFAARDTTLGKKCLAEFMDTHIATPTINQPNITTFCCGCRLTKAPPYTSYPKRNDNWQKLGWPPQSPIITWTEGWSRNFPHTLLPWGSNVWMTLWAPIPPLQKSTNPTSQLCCCGWRMVKALP